MINDKALDRLANILQILNFDMNITQLSNDDLMKHLLSQDKELKEQKHLLQEQNKKYLEKIIEQNNEIISFLRKGNNNG